MFTVATWNSTKGLGPAGKPNKDQLRKAEFVRGLPADLVVICDYGKGQPVDLGFGFLEARGQTLVGSRQSKLERVDASSRDSEVEHATRVKYHSEEDGIVNVLGLYANRSPPRSGSTLSNARAILRAVFDIWGGWLQQPRTLLVGDLNIWEGLGKADAGPSRDIHDILRKMGFRSAFHEANDIEIGKERQNPGRHANPSSMTYEQYDGETHIDYIFYSPDPKVTPHSGVIRHFNNYEGGKKPDGSAGFRGHSAVLASFASAEDT